ncbi:MAG: VWA domain-containing protein [Methanobacteriaceae archaeon]|nr:VWA domain-containing protein [Methanobacteriaceae archaeon]MDP2835696.1 VWA domain-containing protein [Methanobacteriaceae archaeon]MDP3035153.1 VWA domain-containing protein [Methanobacteriaceae archaeon]
MKNLIFPFTAIVGQEEIKKSLILNAINPGIGGVLIKGDKGTGKTTAVRAIADLLPLIPVVKGCAFNCNPHDMVSSCEICRLKNREIEEKKMKVVELPLGSTEDRVVGSIDINKALKEGIKVLEPGILAEANRNILYVDEINLLDDHLVDVLLDAAAYGINNVEREGISISHPSKFMLVGTMNPAEGELRLQLADRIGLHIIVTSIHDIKDRVTIMSRREQFEKDPEEFKKLFANEQKELLDKIVSARKLLSQVQINNDLMELIARISLEVGVDGHRADIAILKTSKAIAAYNGRVQVNEEDLKEAINLVLGERIPGKSQDPDKVCKQMDKAKSEMEREKEKEREQQEKEKEQNHNQDNADQNEEGEKQTLDGDESESESDKSANQNSDEIDQDKDLENKESNSENQSENQNPKQSDNNSSLPEENLEDTSSSHNSSGGDLSNEEEKGQKLFSENKNDGNIESVDVGIDIKKLLKVKGKKKDRLYGKRVESKTEKGKYVRSRFSSQRPKDIAIDATIRAAAMKSSGEIKVEPHDLREKVRKHGARASIALVVDISGSMVSEKKANRVKSILNQIIKDTQRHKDKLSVIGFKGREAEVIIPTTKRAAAFQSKVDEIRVGGTTPLAAGLKKGLEILVSEKKNKEYVPMMVVLTDGMPNVGIKHSPSRDALDLAEKLNENHIHTVVVNFERILHHGRNLNMELAIYSGGRYYDLEDLENPGQIMNKILEYERSVF